MGEAKPLAVKGLVKRYGRLSVLRGVSFELNKGSRIVVVGPNGAGKTTLIKCILGFTRPDEGAVLVYGVSPYSREFDKLRAYIGYMPEGAPLPLTMSVRGYLDLIAALKGCSECVEFARLLGLTGKLNEKISALSQGLRRRLLLAAALCCRPRLLVLDEPYANIDVQTRLIIDRVISELDRDVALLMTTHVRPRAGEYEFYVLVDGRLLRLGAASDEGAVLVLSCGGSTLEMRVTASGRGAERVVELIRRGCSLLAARPYVFEDMLQEKLERLGSS